MKKLLTILLVLCTLTSSAQMRGGSQFDPGAARTNLNNVDAAATPSMMSITLSDKVKAAWADILGDIYASGTVQVSTGTAAAPAYSFASDPDTGIFSAGADTLAFGEGGAEAMRITSDGDLWVGASTAANDAKVKIHSTADTYLKLSSDDNSKWRGVVFGSTKTDSNSYGGTLFNVNTGECRHSSGFADWGGYHTFYASGSEVLRMLTNGNILIATSTDDGANKLQVNGSMRLIGGAAPTAIEGAIYFNSTDKHLYVYNGTGWVQLDN